MKANGYTESNDNNTFHYYFGSILEGFKEKPEIQMGRMNEKRCECYLFGYQKEIAEKSMSMDDLVRFERAISNLLPFDFHSVPNNSLHFYLSDNFKNFVWKNNVDTIENEVCP